VGCLTSVDMPAANVERLHVQGAVSRNRWPVISHE